MIGKEPPIMLLVKLEVKESELLCRSERDRAMYDDREQSLKGTDHFSRGVFTSRSLNCNCRHLICVILPRRLEELRHFCRLTVTDCS